LQVPELVLELLCASIESSSALWSRREIAGQTRKTTNAQTLGSVSRNRQDILPYYGRLVGTLNPYMPDIFPNHEEGGRDIAQRARKPPETHLDESFPRRLAILVLMKVPSFKRTDPRLGQPEPTRHLAVLWQAGRARKPPETHLDESFPRRLAIQQRKLEGDVVNGLFEPSFDSQAQS
jgi:hypothetical protein